MVKQGDIIKLNLDPKEGHEQKGYRPYICLSHKMVTDYANVAVFAPISNTNRDYPLYVSIPDHFKSSGKVLLDQLVTIDFNKRGFRYVEKIDDAFLDELLMKVKVIFQKNDG